MVTIVFNGEEFVEGAIKSIARQTYKNYEHIVVDDGSTDDTPKILAECSRRDQRIKVVRQQNSGIPKAYNRGLALAQGEYIAILDADDLAFPARLEKQVAFLDEHVDVGLVGGAELAFEVESKKAWLVNHPVEDSAIRHAWVHQQLFTHSATMVRREALLQVGHYDENLPRGCDPDLWLRIAQRWKVANLPEPLVLRRHHSKQVTRMRRFDITALNVGMKLKSVHALKLPAYYYLYLVFPLLGMLPNGVKRMFRRLLAQETRIEAKDPERYLSSLSDLL